MATLGRAGDPRLVDRFARAMALELKAVGVTLDFAAAERYFLVTTSPLS